MNLLLDRSAVISECGKYRYRLERTLDDGAATVAGIMVNPSTADAQVDDATIRKWFGFARRNNFSRFIIGNKFAWRATDVKELRTASDPVGPENDAHLEQIMRDADLVVVAWGPLSKLPDRLRTRWRRVAGIAESVGKPLHCLGTAKDGHPLHPLMLSYESQIVDWARPNLAHVG